MCRDQIVLETEFDNSAALSLYESMGFIREKRLFRFYLNGKDAFRLVLVVTPTFSADENDESSDGDFETTRKTLSLPSRPLLSPPKPIQYFKIPPLPYDSDDEVSSR